MPRLLISRTTLSSEPRWARTVARIARPVCRAAAWPAATSMSAPSLPVISVPSER